MVSESQLRLFEKHLTELGGEREELEKQHVPFVSVFDSAENAVLKQRKALQDIIKGALREEGIDVAAAGAPETEILLDEPEAKSESDRELDQILEDVAGDLGAAPAADLDEAEEYRQIEQIDDDLADIELEEEEFDEGAAAGREDAEEAFSGEFALPQKYQLLDKSFSKTQELLTYDQVFSRFGDAAGAKDEDLAALEDQKDELSIDGERFSAAREYKSMRQFSEEDERLFFENLDQYNIVIKKAVVAIFENEQTSYFSERLVDLILDGAPAQTVFRECERLLGVTLPRLQDFTVYDDESLFKRLVTRSEKLKQSAKIVSTRIMPAVLAAAAVIFFGFFFVVQPLRAVFQYQLGFAALKENDYETSEARFRKGADLWEMKKYYFSYAEEYEKQRRYDEAKTKYTQLIFGLDDELRAYLQQRALEGNLLADVSINGRYVSAEGAINYTREGFRRLAAFTRDTEGNFAEAEKYYDLWLFKHPSDSGMYIEKADTDIDWYDAEKNPQVLSRAQEAYDKVIDLRGADDTALIARLRYAIRAGEEDYIRTVGTGIIFSPANFKPVFMLTPYTELVMYRLDQNRPGYAADILDIIKKRAPKYIHLNYLYAQYYRQTGDAAMRMEFLQRALRVYENEPLLRGKSLYYALSAKVDLGDALLNEADNVLSAKEQLLRVQDEYELLGDLIAEPYRTNLARLYVLQAEAAVLEEKIPLAREYLVQAQERGYESVDMTYQQGAVEYLSKNYYQSAQRFLSLAEQYNTMPDEDPLAAFLAAGDDFGYTLRYDAVEKKRFIENRADVLLAAANALYLSGNYSAAALYYEKTLATMNETVRVMDDTNFWSLASQPDLHRTVQNIVYAKNNFGASLYELSRTRETRMLRSRAVDELVDASRILQNAYRLADGVRILAPDVPQNNLNAIVANSAALRIYSGILLSLSSENPRYYNLEPIARS